MRYRRLGDTGLRVSEVALGTMTFGEDWGWGADEGTCRDIFDAYVDAGGNFIDTANNYTNGTAERIVGNLVSDDRDRYVIATKYTLNTRDGDPNAGGNGRKNLFQSVDASLERLDTDYVDLLWVHAWDGVTPVEEVLRGLDDLVSAGGVHHVGFSDTPAWVVARAQTLAQERDWTPVSALQVKYNLLERAVERDLLPMARDLGLGVTTWGALESGVLTGKYTTDDGEGRVTTTGRELTDRDHEVTRVVVDVADELDATPAQVAVAWLVERDVIPILGATTPVQLTDTLAALDVSLGDDHRARLDEVSDIEYGFPHDFLASEMVQQLIFGDTRDRFDR